MNLASKRYLSFIEMLSDQKKDSVAIIFDDNGEKKQVTYGELIAKINKFPVSDKKCVGILCENNLQTIVAIFAYAKANKQMVLLNPKDPLESIIKKIKLTDVQELYGDPTLVSILNSHLEQDVEGTIDGAIIFFTSGTTADPKAVVLTEKSLCASAYNVGRLLPLDSNDILLSFLPLCYVFGFVSSLLWGLSFGVKVALGRKLKYIFDDGRYFAATAIAADSKTATFMVNNRIFHDALRVVLLGASPIPIKIIEAMKARKIKVAYEYCLTETSSCVALATGNDPLQMTICPDDKVLLSEENEILIKSKTCMMQGYYKDEKATNEALIDGVFHTGDIGRIDQYGYLCVMGRMNDAILLSDGSKVFCPQYEDDLRYFIPNLEYAITQVNGLIYLFIVSKFERKDIEENIKHFNQAKIHSQRIAKILYIANGLPKTKNGKVKRWALLSYVS